MLLNLGAHIVVDVLNLAIGVYVLLKNPRSALHRAFFLFVFGVVSWSAGMMLLLWTRQPWFITVTLWGGELTLLGFIWFAQVFPDSRLERKYFFLLLLPWIALFLATPSSLFIRSAVFQGHGYLEPENGPLFPLFAAGIAIYIVVSVAKLFRTYRRLEGIRRVQVRYFAAGAMIFLVFGFVTDVLLPAFGVFHFNLLGPLSSVALIGCTAYAMVRHQFMDTRIIIGRGLLYAFFLTIIAVIFFGIDFILELFIEDNAASDVLAAMVGAFGFMWLRRFFEKATDRFLFRKGYDYAAAVRELGPLLHSTIDLRGLLATLDAFLMRTAKPERVIFVFYRTEGEPLFQSFFHGAPMASDLAAYEKIVRDSFMAQSHPLFIQELEKDSDGNVDPIAIAAEQCNIAAIIPLHAREGAPAVMLLGKKLSDDIFRREDMELLATLAHHAGMAIENARLYEKVRRHAEELEARVMERTEAIRRMQEAQSKFLEDISHELQTPVAVLKGNVEILERKRRGERKMALHVIQSTLDRMAQMVDHLLAIARLNFSKEKLHKREIMVENILEEVYGDCLILAENQGIVLSYVSDDASVSADKDKLKEVILNFVSNALKHTPRGGKIALVGKRMGADAEIIVEDTGSGIPPEDLPRIFERFYRINAGRTSGTGLGLDICRKIVEMHGGRVRAESEVGEGSRFIVSLPAADQ
jgi:signal transduction histidine kinase